MGDDHTGMQPSASRLSEELTEDFVDQPGDIGEEASIVAEERAQRLGNGEHELSMRQLEKDLVGEMLGKEDRPLPAAGWAEIEPLARERPEVVMAAFGVGTADARDALKVVATGAEPLPNLLDTLKAIAAVGGGVLLIVLGTEVAEVPLEYSMEFVTATRNVPVCRRGRDRDCRAHMNVYGRNHLPASDRGRAHRAPHNMAHSPDAFSSLRSCEGAGDARRSAASYTSPQRRFAVLGFAHRSGDSVVCRESRQSNDSSRNDRNLEFPPAPCRSRGSCGTRCSDGRARSTPA